MSRSLGNDKLLASIGEYYDQKFAAHGTTPHGSDWNGEESQLARFDALLDMIDEDKESFITINELGCGYGAMFGPISNRFLNFHYHGYELSPVIANAARNFISQENATIHDSETITEIADYSFASGLFNVKLDSVIEVWEDYVFSMMDEMFRKSKRAFAFNMLTSFSDVEFRKDYLYYGNPSRILDWCLSRYSRRVILKHDYERHEFVVLVKKPGFEV